MPIMAADRRFCPAVFFLQKIKLEKTGTAREQVATILLPNCRILNGTGKVDAVLAPEKRQINKDLMVRYATRTHVNKRITKPLLYR
jgi:hypothetical protein